MTKGLLICMAIALLAILPTIYNEFGSKSDAISTIIYEIGEDMMNNVSLYNLDVRVFDEETNKYVIDIFLAKIPKHPYMCIMSDFELRESYANFVATYIDIVNENRMSVRFRLKTNEREDDVDVWMSIQFHESLLESHEAMRHFALRTFTAPIPHVFASRLDIGDFAIDNQNGQRFVLFVRGNVSVDVMTNGFRDINIIELSREIDQQILEIITGAGNK